MDGRLIHCMIQGLCWAQVGPLQWFTKSEGVCDVNSRSSACQKVCQVRMLTSTRPRNLHGMPLTTKGNARQTLLD